MQKSTLSLVQDLKHAQQDFEWYPTTKNQIKVIIDDIKDINESFDFTHSYSERVKVLDVGAGDGRVLHAIQSGLECDSRLKIDCFAIEKATIHTSTYRGKGITLLGTEFKQTNFISKKCEIAFVNPPYSEFSHWLQTLICHLNFGLLYAVIPERWENDPAIKEVMELRGVKFAKILAKSDFFDAERKARAKVHVVRFSFNNLIADRKFDSVRYKPNIDRDSSDPFQIFIEKELGLKQTYSETTEKFNEYTEKQRIKNDMNTEGTECYELIQSKGVLWALLDSCERDLANTLKQYKLISTIDDQLLQELGVDYKALRAGIKDKLLGFRNVYWSLLFEKLDAISSRLTNKHKKALLKKLSDNSLDFTYTNAVYVISYAVEMGNELIECSLIDVYKNLTSSDAILRYYKSNERVYSDNWRYTEDANNNVKYLLDYRFIHSSWSNFGSNSWEKGLNEGAQAFTNDLMVALKLLGYSNLYISCSYEDINYGDKLSIMSDTKNGADKELVTIRYYKNGNKHLKFNQEAMLKLNVTISRLLNWVRSKDEFINESDSTGSIDDSVWNISNKMKLTTSNILKLTCKAA